MLNKNKNVLKFRNKKNGYNEKKSWYIIQVYSGKEKKIKNDIEERIKLKGLGYLFGKILIPTEKIIEIKDGHKKKVNVNFSLDIF